jgi:heptose I phosphotransferase
VLSSAQSFHVAPGYEAVFRELGIDAETIFNRSDVKVWRSITERENCTLDARLDGRSVRFHIKRYKDDGAAALGEARGISTLIEHGIPTVPLVAWGRLGDGRSFLVTEDLYGYRDAEKLVRGGVPFAKVLNATADLAATLHARGLHHRDLYLCHFFARETDPSDVRLIDAGRVRRLPPWPVRRRWIVKDLAQFWYSIREDASEEQKVVWLSRYAARRGNRRIIGLRPAIERKCAWIARHDARLKEKQAGRNVSLPT